MKHIALCLGLMLPVLSQASVEHNIAKEYGIPILDFEFCVED